MLRVSNYVGDFKLLVKRYSPSCFPISFGDDSIEKYGIIQQNNDKRTLVTFSYSNPHPCKDYTVIINVACSNDLLAKETMKNISDRTGLVLQHGPPHLDNFFGLLESIWILENP